MLSHGKTKYALSYIFAKKKYKPAFNQTSIYNNQFKENTEARENVKRQYWVAFSKMLNVQNNPLFFKQINCKG